MQPTYAVPCLNLGFVEVPGGDWYLDTSKPSKASKHCKRFMQTTYAVFGCCICWKIISPYLFRLATRSHCLCLLTPLSPIALLLLFY